MLHVLKENPYFSSLPSGEARELIARLRERHYRTGDVIFRKGDRCEGLFIVLSGRVRTSITSTNGREQVLKVSGRVVRLPTFPCLMMSRFRQMPSRLWTVKSRFCRKPICSIS